MPHAGSASPAPKKTRREESRQDKDTTGARIKVFCKTDRVKNRGQTIKVQTLLAHPSRSRGIVEEAFGDAFLRAWGHRFEPRADSMGQWDLCYPARGHKEACLQMCCCNSPRGKKKASRASVSLCPQRMTTPKKLRRLKQMSICVILCPLSHHATVCFYGPLLLNVDLSNIIRVCWHCFFSSQLGFCGRVHQTPVSK